MRKAVRFFPLVPAIILLIPVISGSLLSAQTSSVATALQTTSQPSPPTVAEATEFIRQAETRLNDLTVKASRAAWVLPDFCGQCSNCVRIAEADALEERFAEAVEARENLREADKRDTRLFVQTRSEERP